MANLSATAVPFNQLHQKKWDAVVIGGGITGAGIAMQAAKLGYKVLLVEQKDFAWGTSSRSSKMVHGGLRYLEQGNVLLTRHSLVERERMIKELPQLVQRQRYWLPIIRSLTPGKLKLRLGLMLYDLLAGIRDHYWVGKPQLLAQCSALNNTPALTGAMSYSDAITDDCRLVMTTLIEAVNAGATVANYTKVTAIEHYQLSKQAWASVHLQAENGDKTIINTPVVFNATGLWADSLSASTPRVRPQRGSHQMFSAARFPLVQGLTLIHPSDGRVVFVYPWHGLTCIGTTDLDHKGDFDHEPECTTGETDYLLALLAYYFPSLALGRDDIVSSMAGVRPIIASGKGLNPSQESRGHSVWRRGSVISASGGKLTTFRQIAIDALLAAKLIGRWQAFKLLHSKQAFFTYIPSISAPDFTMLNQVLTNMPSDSEALAMVGWAMQHEMVQHLDDCLLRRTRLGNQMGS